MTAGNDGPSKNELKKMAKKAEKAAKKQSADSPPSTNHADLAAHPPAATGASKPAANTPEAADAVSAEFVRPVQSYQLALPASLTLEQKMKALKAVWTAQTCNVDVGRGALSDGVALMYGDQTVSSGNSMALALALPHATELWDSLRYDEWCEWEANVLCRASTIALQEAALAHLNEALVRSTTGIYLVGEHASVADVVVLVTLQCLILQHHSTQHIAQHHASMAKYLAAHQASYEVAQAQLEKLQNAKLSGPSLFGGGGATADKSTTIDAAFEVDMQEPSLLTVLDHVFRTTFVALFSSGQAENVPLPDRLVKDCSKPKDGDYQCDAAMSCFAALKKTGSLPDGVNSPQGLAQLVVDALGDAPGRSQHPVVMDLKVTGPGFIVCRLRPTFLQVHVNTIVQTGALPLPKVPPQTCLVDFSSPNIAKEMHVGHLRSTIIGECVCRVLERVGHVVHRVNHIGDWGTQFGMLIQFLKEEYPHVGEPGAELPNITDLTEFYKKAKQRFDESAEFKKTSQTNVVKLQSGNAECVRIWQLLCDVSRLEFEKVYKRLDVTVKEVGESFYNDKIAPVIAEFEQAGLLKTEEGGAKCVFVDGFKAPLMLQKSDGGYGYDSTDMAALKYRLFEIRADRIIVITDYSQGDHFKMIYAAGHDIGWVRNNQRLEHIGFGTVMGEDGKRFKTRSGDTVRLVDLLDEAVSRMEATLLERNKDGKGNVSTEAELHEVSEAIGYGAVKYYDLRRNPTSNYKFSYGEMLDTKGDTAVYLLYARVRLESICAKALAEHNVDVGALLASPTEHVVLTHPSERSLAVRLLMFPDMLSMTLDDLFPYHICEYVYKLSIAASEFVTKCKVLGSPEMNSRLLLCYATTIAMKQCFDLLGIRHVKRI